MLPSGGSCGQILPRGIAQQFVYIATEVIVELLLALPVVSYHQSTLWVRVEPS